ncbi:MFS transporter [Kitasatospora sp. NPDC097691]|uniref:MFS transporter n=1 Tax=Kitasatospora sp. NPDC097691 TaxID=3157231 RepID=UPI003328A11E
MSAQPRSRGLAALVGSLFLVDLGAAMCNIALPLLLVQDYGFSVAVGLTLALQVVPSVLFGPIAGSMIDRFEPRRLAVVSAVGSGLLVAVIPFADALWQLQVLGVAVGIANMIEGPVRLVLRSSVIEEGDELRGNGLIVTAERVPSVLGPLLVALVFALGEVRVVFFVGALLGLLAGALMYFVPGPGAQPDAQPGADPDARAGANPDAAPESDPERPTGWRALAREAYVDNTRSLLRTIGKDRFMRGLTLTAFTYVCAVSVGRFALIQLGAVEFHAVPGFYGYLAGAMALGGVVGGLVAGRLTRFRNGSLYIAGNILEAVAWIAVATTGSTVLALLMMCAAGVLESIATTVFFAEAQTRVPEEVAGYYYAALIPLTEAFGFAGAGLGAAVAAWSGSAAAVCAAALIAVPVLLTARWYLAPARAAL